MKHIRLALAAIAALALGTAPALAQDKPVAAPKPITKEQRDQGLKEAPAAITAAGLTCDLSDAAYLGEANKAKAYEVACKGAMGYIILSAPPVAAGAKPADGGGPKYYDCLTTLGNANLACRLPGNADPKQGLAPLIAAGGGACAIKDGRAIGANKKGEAYYEAACSDGSGFIIQKMAPGVTPAVSLIPCIGTLDSQNIACKLTSRADTVAYVAKMAAPSGKTCAATNARYVGASSSTGETFYELACSNGSGFIFKTDKAGAFQIAIDCGKASGVAGGCTLTDTTKAATEENNNYTLLAKAGGFNCNVKQYRFIGMVSEPTKGEVVELACSNRPDGTVAVFPVDAKAKPSFIDCVRSGQYGDVGTCKLTPLQPIYERFSAALAAKGRKSCVVSGARYLGHSSKNTDYIETACADGGPGWVIEFAPDDAVKELLSCGQAKAAGLECKLPTNVGK